MVPLLFFSERFILLRYSDGKNGILLNKFSYAKN